MANRVLLGNLGSGQYGLKVSKEGADVTSTAAQNLIFDSTKPRTGQIYAGGSTSGTSSTITWTSGSKATLTYIPMYLIFEQNARATHFNSQVTNFEEDEDITTMNNQSDAWKLTNSSIAPVTTPEAGWLTHQTAYDNGNYNGLSNTSFALFSDSRTSNATTFVVLRIPCGYGFMGSSYLDGSGTTQTLANHPTLGNTENLWT